MPTIRDLAIALEKRAGRRVVTLVDCLSYYEAVFRAYNAAFGWPGYPGGNREPTVRLSALTAISGDVVRDVLNELYVVLDTRWTAVLGVEAAKEASRWAWASSDEPRSDRAYEACDQVVQAFQAAYGHRNTRIFLPASGAAVRVLALYVDAMLSATKEFAAAGGDLSDAAIAYEAYDDAAQAAYDAAYEADDERAMDVADAARTAVAPYAAYSAWRNAAREISTLIRLIPGRTR